MADHGSLGSLLQGVSQQPQHIRNDGQVTEQINMLSDIVDGLTSRPPVTIVGTVDLPDNLNFIEVRIEGSPYYIAFNDDSFYVLNPEGVAIDVDVQGNALDYVGSNMTAYTYDGTAYIINRDKVVEKDADLSQGQAEVITDIGLVSCLGGLFSHTYSVTVEYPNGSKVSSSYTCPDGVEDGDAARTTSDYIIARLAAGLRGGGNASSDVDYRGGLSYIDRFGEDFNFTGLPDNISQWGTAQAGTVIQTAGSILMVRGVPGIKISVEDGSGGDSLRHQTSIAKDTDELAEFAPHGTLVRVLGLDGTEDDFFMRFEVDNEDTVGNSFGSDGIWREWYDPFEEHSFDPDTMPHVIKKAGDTFVFSKGEWQGRRTGNEDTNPFPSFLGSSIRDINGFQSRLMFVSGGNTIMSRTNIPTDFFKQSVVADTATDPIDIVSTSEEEFVLNWIIPFDRDVVIFSDNAQFLISGAGALTSTNASLVQTTQFEVSEDTKPVSTGRTVLFPFQAGSFGGIKEFYSVNSEDANSAVDITKVQDKYIPSPITDIQCSTNFDTVLVRSSSELNAIYVHQYYWDGSQKAQQAWHKWILPYEIVHMYFDNSEIRMILKTSSGYIIATADLERANDAVGYNVTLDMKEVSQASEFGDLSTIYSPLSGTRFVQSTGCLNPGHEVYAESSLSGDYFFDKTIVPIGAEVIHGIPYRVSFKPTMPFIRDREGKVQQRAKLVVTNFTMYYEDSGHMYANMYSKYRSDPLQQDNKEYVEFLDPDFNGINVSSGTWEIEWGERSDWSELEIYTDDVRPLTITDLEWFGQPLTRGRRM